MRPVGHGKAILARLAGHFVKRRGPASPAPKRQARFEPYPQQTWLTEKISAKATWYFLSSPFLPSLFAILSGRIRSVLENSRARGPHPSILTSEGPADLPPFKRSCKLRRKIPTSFLASSGRAVFFSSEPGPPVNVLALLISFAIICQKPATTGDCIAAEANASSAMAPGATEKNLSDMAFNTAKCAESGGLTFEKVQAQLTNKGMLKLSPVPSRFC